MTLEEKIRALMEAQTGEALLSEAAIEELEEKETIKTKNGTTISDDSDDQEDQDEDQEDDHDEDGDKEESDDEDQEETELAGDTGKKNKVAVKEGTDPFGKLSAAGVEGSGAADNAKIKSGLGRKDAAPGKLTAASGSVSDSAATADNTKIKAGVSKSDKGGKVSDGETKTGVDADNARNAVKEHMTALFSGEELSEEFQAKAATIFEAAVLSAATEKVEALAEEYAQQIVSLQESLEDQLVEAVEEVKSSLVEDVDGFLTEMVNEWVSDNQIALESGMKVEMVDSFIDGLKSLFNEHYVDVPEDKLDVIEEQVKDIEGLSEQVASLSEESESLKAELVSLKSALIAEAVSGDLTSVQEDKFKSLIEHIEFVSAEDYQEKLETIKESYFPNGQTLVTESVENDVTVSDNMSLYVSAVAQNLKFK